MTPGTLGLYLMRQFLISAGLVLMVLVVVLFTAEVVEHLRRASNAEGVRFSEVLTLAIYKTPSIIAKVWPFVALFGTMLALTRLARSSELTVMRAAGVSAWQIIGPMALTALLAGAVLTMAVNPLSAAMTKSYDQMFNQHFRDNASLISVSRLSGLWLREASPEGAQVVHAMSVSNSGAKLGEATFLILKDERHFVRRIDAREAILGDGVWRLRDAVITTPDAPPARHAEMTTPTTLDMDRIHNSLAAPETISFWRLPGFINVLKASGFNGRLHSLSWQSALCLPFFLSAMVLLAAAFCLGVLPRGGGVGWVLLFGVMAGFSLFFITDVVGALGAAGKIPVTLAAWAPAAATAMAAAAAIFHQEDG